MYFNRNFLFTHSVRAGHHYYDNRSGAPLNYLAYLISGECRIESENNTYRFRTGDIIYVPKGYHYQSFWSGERIEFVTFAFFDTGTREELRTQPLVIPADPSLAEAMLTIPTERGGAVTCRSLSRFYDVLDRLMPYLVQGNGRDSKMVKQAKIYIADHPRCTVPEMAAACGVSESYLYVVFRREGVTPNSVKLQVLCEMAVDLLTTTDLRVEEIAEYLGFSSDAYFRKIFKKQTGMSPIATRKTAMM